MVYETRVPHVGDTADTGPFRNLAKWWYSSEKHQIINMYTSDDGSQGVFDTDEAWWNLRTGTNYGTGLNLLAAPNGGDS